MDKAIIKWQFKDGQHHIFCSAEGESMDPEVVKVCSTFHQDINRVMTAMLGYEVNKAPFDQPDVEMTVSFYKENEKINTDYKMTVPPATERSWNVLQGMSLMVTDWLNDHFRVALERKAVYRDLDGFLKRRVL